MLKVGDAIKCADKNDAVQVTNELSSIGVYTDFLFEKDGEQGLWIVVKRIEEKRCENGIYRRT